MSRREALGRVGALLGGLVSAPTVAGVLGGCTRSTDPDWAPQTLTSPQTEMVATLAEIIIPATDTPGARGAHVHRFIDAMLTGSYLPESRDRFLDGLGEVDARCEETFGDSFLNCSTDQQRTLVETLDAETFGSGSSPADRENPAFFRMLKELTIVGYYTSEVGATQELKTNIVPGRFEGDVPYEEIGRTWA